MDKKGVKCVILFFVFMVIVNMVVGNILICLGVKGFF